MNGECIARLVKLGISESDAYALRRIAMTLHRWHERECGDGNDFASWCIVRGRLWRGSFDGPAPCEKARETGTGFIYDDNGAPYIERHFHAETHARYESIPDRERGAHKRLAAIMRAYPTLTPYVQGDPRGAALYILRPEDMIPGAQIDSFYSRGVAVYR